MTTSLRFGGDWRNCDGMKKKRRSLNPPVKRSTDSNSKDALSGNSAAKKSSKFKNERRLRVATPTNRRLDALKESGLLAPEEIYDDEEMVPLDFTVLSSRDIGGVHSRFAVRHSHALFAMALVAAELAHLRRDLKLYQAQYRVRHKGEYKVKYELDDAMALSKRHKSITEKITEAEALVTVMEAVVHGFEDLRNAASREISRRLGEQAPRD
jgi:hypothetical protein